MVQVMDTPKLPLGKVKAGTQYHLYLTDGEIEAGKVYEMPKVGKADGQNGMVVDIHMVWADDLSFWVTLEDGGGVTHMFEYKEE